MGTALAIGIYKGLNDCKIAKLLTDAAGSAATYGTPMDINIQSIDVSSVNYDEAELPFDEIIGDISEKLKTIEGTIQAATRDLDVLALITGGTIATTSASSGKTSFSLGADDLAPYFKIAFKSEYDESTSSVKDKHIVICKAKIRPDFGSFKQSADGYTTFSFSFKAIPLKGTYTPATGAAKTKCIITEDHFGAVTAIS